MQPFNFLFRFHFADNSRAQQQCFHAVDKHNECMKQTHSVYIGTTSNGLIIIIIIVIIIYYPQ